MEVAPPGPEGTCPCRFGARQDPQDEDSDLAARPVRTQRIPHVPTRHIPEHRLSDIARALRRFEAGLVHRAARRRRRDRNQESGRVPDGA